MYLWVTACRWMPWKPREGCGQSAGELNQKQLSVDSPNFVLLRIKMSAVLFYKTFHVEDFPEILSS